MENGLLKEIQELIQKGYSQTAAQAIGYKEFFDYLQGNGTLADAISRVQQESRRYAKRQLTWFRREENIHWLHVDAYPDSLALVSAAQSILDIWRCKD